MKKDNKPYNKTYSILLGLAILAVVMVFLRMFNASPMWDFRNNLYLPAQLLTQHQSPYNIHVLVTGSNAVWFPMAMGIFFPLGYLNYELANNIWWLLNFFALLALVWIAIGQKKPPLLYLALSLVWIFIFPSTTSHINLGQISILICLVMLLIIHFNQRFPDWLIGFLLAFSLIKPQLSIFFIPAFFYKILREKGWQAILRLVIWTIAGVLLTLLPVVLLYPNWLPDFISNLADNPSWAHPSIFTLFFQTNGSSSDLLTWLWTSIGMILSLIIIARFHRYNQSQESKKEIRRFEHSLLWVLALTPIFSPYIWSWDFVLLYPLIVVHLFKKQRSLKTILLFAGYYAILIFYVAQKLSGQIYDLHFWWVPWSVILFTGFIEYVFNAKYISMSKNINKV